MGGVALVEAASAGEEQLLAVGHAAGCSQASGGADVGEEQLLAATQNGRWVGMRVMAHSVVASLFITFKESTRASPINLIELVCLSSGTSVFIDFGLLRTPPLPFSFSSSPSR
jgi:hypothetical protein